VEGVLHLARNNFLGMSGNKELENVAEQTMHKYGIGSCGPRGFYGTIDVHLLLEKKIAEFMRMEDAILYSSSFCTVSSAIPAFSKRGDLLICDKGVSHAVQTGVLLSRSRVFFFKHNDLDDLERILKETMPKDKSDLVRKFVIIESLYYNYGDIAPLKQIMALKEKYCFRLIMDECYSVGVLGKTGRGLCEHAGVDPNEIEILTGALSNAFGAGGGFCCGSKQVVYHQRLNSSGYVFSASLPPFLAACAQASLDLLDKNPELLTSLAAKVVRFHAVLKTVPGLVITSDVLSPVIHIRLAKSTGSRDTDEDALEAIVQHALDHDKVFLTRAKYIDNEKFPPPPSIRVCLNATMLDSDVDATGVAIKNAVKTVLSAYN